MSIDRNDLKNLANAVETAQARLVEYIACFYPVGSRVQVKLRHGQKNMSPATVVDIEPGYSGTVVVEIDNSKAWSRQLRRSIAISDVFPLDPEQSK